MADDGVTLATSGLTISKDGAVVTLPGVFQHGHPKVGEDTVLWKEYRHLLVPYIKVQGYHPAQVYKRIG